MPKYNSGDVVIKTTGGNKMTINNLVLDGGKNKYRCFWFIESSLNEGVFNEEDIVTLEEYKRFLKTEERDDKIDKLLK